MKITVFSSNQPRHINLVKELSVICDEVFFISEVNTIFPGLVHDNIPKSRVMELYFSYVIESERKIFGDVSFLPNNVKTLAIKSGDLNELGRSQLGSALSSDIYIVFGASYIKGWLVDFLSEKRALNIHLGISPYYRGSACNFWALYDNKPGYVGATIHYLNSGLDTGDILFHCMPEFRNGDNSFDFSMRAVLVAHQRLVREIQCGCLFKYNTLRQEISEQIRYSKKSDFNDRIAKEFLQRENILDVALLSYPKLFNEQFG